MTESAEPLLHDDEASAEPRLGRGDWVDAALEVLVEEGVEAVRITRLADGLSVTRGSFYWHFKGREDLLAALLDEWSVRNTGIMVDVLRNAESLETGILDLFSVWVDHSKFDPDLDRAVRDWGRREGEVRDVVSKEDDDRVEAIARFYERHGYKPTEAFIRARVIYFTQLSYYSLGVSEPMEERMSYLSAYFQCFTGREIDASVAKEFRRRLIAKEKAS